MKIAILTSGRLPVPAVKGGAVENLLDFCLAYNDTHRLHDITVYSVAHPQAEVHEATKSAVNHYRFIDLNSFWSKVCKKFHSWGHANGYYDSTTEYFLWRIIQDIKKSHYDILLIENRPGYVLRLKSLGVPMVIHQENDYLNNKVRQYQEIYDGTSLIINTSEYVTRCVRSINSNDSKCVTVLNGIDTRRFYDAQPKERQALGLHSEDFVIVYSGRLTPEKGILELIEAIDQTTCRKHIKLLVIGASFYGNDTHQSPFAERLEKACEDIREQVIFTGFVDYQQIPSYLKAGDLAIVPSLWEEPFGLTVAEAMAAGLPLITTISGGIPEICEGVATLVEREQLTKQLATAIDDLFESPAKRKEMAEASLKRSLQFDKDTYAKEYFAALNTLTL